MAIKRKHNRPPLSATPEPKPEIENRSNLSFEEQEDTKEPDKEPGKMTLLEATEAMAIEIRGICRRTKLSEQTILNLFSFQFQQVERSKQEMLQQQMQGQAAVDAIAAEEAAKHELREPEEDITADD